MRARVTGNDLADQKADLAVCFAHENDKQPGGVKDATLRRELAKQMKADGFLGQPGDRLVWNTNGRYAARRFLVLGLGPARDDHGAALRSAAARASRAAQRFAAKSMALVLPRPGASTATATDVRAALEGAVFGAYEFDRYLTDPHRKAVRLDSLEVGVGAVGAPQRKAAKIAQVGARAVGLARDVVNEAPSRMTPVELARTATREAKRAGLRCKVLGPPELRKIGMHALLAVARGSAEPPRVVHLTYTPRGRKPAGRTARPIVLVGKGVTFDSGGLNLKPGDSMLAMKSDMAGSAAVLATMTTLAEIGCKSEVHALLGLTENMTGGAAYKPGDILDTYRGKTVEVGNTDAEGRLVLCDLLAWAADELKPRAMVDLATLTGACVVALGTMASGLFTRHEALGDALLAASREAGEKLWPLPMYDEYIAQLQRGPADLRNIGDRWGGATTAALFLGEFLPRELNWAHLDIAGPAFVETDLPETPAGATGAGVLTLMRWLEAQ